MKSIKAEKDKIDWSEVFISTLKALGILVLIIAMSEKEWYGVLISLIFYIMIDILGWLVAFASHHRCNECGKVCWMWQNCTRPSDAYHQECFDKKYKQSKEEKNKQEV